MSRKEKVIWILAYAVTAVLTILPFFQVGVTNSDDFLYYNMSYATWSQLVEDAKFYASSSGRFYFIITKYFYYVPYLIDSVVWTKLTQYVPLIGCYVLFSYLVFRIFRSIRLGALTLLLLIFNMTVGMDWFYPPTAYPYYFSFSLLIFLCGILFFVDYTEKGGYWRVVASCVMFFVSYLFYEDYLVFTLIFLFCLVVRRWKVNGKEIVPYAITLILYLACYFGYSWYLMHTNESFVVYDGSRLSSNFSFANFFKILYNFTTYTLPCKTFILHNSVIAENSQLISGHYNSLCFALINAPANAYFNALIQCLILWFILKKAKFKNISWRLIGFGAFIALFFAFSAHILIAITDKYNVWATWMQVYVTSFYSYFGVMLTIAIIVVALVKLCSKEKVGLWLKMACCILLFVLSVVSYYTNDHLSREWKKSQNRITMLELIKEENAYDHIPQNSILYIESLRCTSYFGLSICYETEHFNNLISRIAGKNFIFAKTKEELQTMVSGSPDAPIYFIQATETKKNCELLLAISHISHYDSDIDNVTADKADVYYYSPTKNYVLFYSLNDGEGSVEHKSVGVISNDIHKKITHVNLEKEGMWPLGFSISNMMTQTSETVYLP